METSLTLNSLSPLWGLPFLGVVLSIAFGPFWKGWHHHFGKIMGGWMLAFMGPFLLLEGPQTLLPALFETTLHHYAPFSVAIFALVTVMGGIKIHLPVEGTPASNMGVLTLGTLLSGWIGTTGASMLLIRPLLVANQWRRHKVHLFIFFIFLVSNIGGGLTPLGDPPLFLGFLMGVPFFWTVTHLWQPLLGISGGLLLLCYGLECYYFAQEPQADRPHKKERFRIEGWQNLGLLVGVLILIAGSSHPTLQQAVCTVPGVAGPIGTLSWVTFVREPLLILIALLSWWMTPQKIRQSNHFSWAPVQEVMIIFAAIFMTLTPVSMILHAKTDGAFGPLLGMLSTGGVPDPRMYFWISGLLSAFLDNAPTYMVFFQMAGGDPCVLTTSLADTLKAISLGAVLMGAMTYIGNAPNFMVRSMALERGVKMPSFFGFLGWSCVILLPFLWILSQLAF